MSVEEYEKVLPDVFNNPGEKLSEVPKRGEPEAHGSGQHAKVELPRKGFADLIEFQKGNVDGGLDIEVIPAERLIPKSKKSTAKEKRYDSHALIHRRVIFRPLDVSKPSRLIRVELEIQSPVLCAWLRDSVPDTYEGTNFQTVPIKLRSPFQELFFCRVKIRDLAASEHTEPSLRSDAQVLLDFIHNNGMLSSVVKDSGRYALKGQVPGDILWSIYPPNSLVVLNSGAEAERECWMVRRVTELVDQAGAHWWKISGLRLGCDGKAPGLVRQEAILCQVSMGLMDIADLPLVPVDRYRDWDRLEPALRTRAETIRRVLGKTMCDFKIQTYSGPAWESAKVNFDETWTGLQGPLARAKNKQIDERVIPDVVAFLRHGGGIKSEVQDLRGKAREPQLQHETGKGRGILSSDRAVQSSDACSDPDCKIESCLKKREKMREKMGEVADPDPHELLKFQAFDFESEVKVVEKINYSPEDLDELAKTVEAVFRMPKERLILMFPAFLPAFCLKSKTWRYIRSDDMKDTVWSKDAFEFLQLPLTTKHLITSLVKGHNDSVNTGFDDVVGGKGQGLIFLLHGQPGLGKTLTAEGIADYLQRPLYSISGGELSTDVSEAETTLDTIFNVAKRWDAVSLLDEADVLLCKRTSSDLQRNAIIGVFLRKLEYFQGVLFLTTNRKQDLDDAFKSRIHVTISYPALSNAAQSSIWRNLVEKNSKAGVKTDEVSDEIFKHLGRLNLNGRTIKNILRTAVAYSCAEARPLSARHIFAIVETEVSEVDNDLVDENLTEVEQQTRSQVKGSLETLRRLVGTEEIVRTQ